jgi:hypothetical protein
VVKKDVYLIANAKAARKDEYDNNHYKINYCNIIIIII